MMTKRWTTGALASLTILAATLWAVPARDAEPPLSKSHIFAVLDRGAGGVRSLADGDLLEAGGRYRVEISAQQDIYVRIRAGADGKIELLPATRIERGRDLVLPTGDSAFTAPIGGEKETILIETWPASGGPRGPSVTTLRHDLTLVPKGYLSAGTAGLTVPSLEGVEAGALPAAARLQARAGDARAAARARAYAAALGKASYRFAGMRSRGLKEANLYRDVSPGVVLIVADDGMGSGSVISSKGEILTNAHVVKGAKRVGVVFKPKTQAKVKPSDVVDAVVVKVDEVADLALLRVRRLPPGQTILAFGKLGDIEVGADVHAIGHPRGESWTYTKGIVSQIRKDYRWSARDGLKHHATVIQTQTPINPGNSGGPLLTDGRKIVGVNSFQKRGQGLNFAVAVDEVKRFLAAPEGRVAERRTPRRAHAAAGRPGSRQPGSPGAGRPVARKEPKYFPKDTNGDGKIDLVGIDRDHNGKMDAYLVDENKDGRMDTMLLDRDENGKPEAKLIDRDGDGKFDTWLIDADEDGKIDMIGYDPDQDGRIDRYQKVT